MNKWSHVLLIIILLALVAGPVIFLPDSDYEGADNLAEEMIITVNPHYEPWMEPLWKPPSGEIESLLFAVQAAAGSALIGFYLGRITARKKSGS